MSLSKRKNNIDYIRKKMVSSKTIYVLRITDLYRALTVNIFFWITILFVYLSRFINIIPLHDITVVLSHPNLNMGQ